jgi:hypothetical protein
MLHQNLELLDPVLDPLETHIHALGELGNHRAICETNGTLIVAEDERGRLWVAHIIYGGCGAQRPKFVQPQTHQRGRRRAEGDHFSLTTLFKCVGEEVAKWTGVRVRVVSTSLINSSPLLINLLLCAERPSERRAKSKSQEQCRKTQEWGRDATQNFRTDRSDDIRLTDLKLCRSYWSRTIS